jgi:hypothetical protein
VVDPAARDGLERVVDQFSVALSSPGSADAVAA